VAVAVGPGPPRLAHRVLRHGRQAPRHGFDIHGGGFDLVFPHHENEIAQYEAAHGGPFARHWIHNGMVRMGEEKMSKSLGNIVSLDEAYGRWGRGPLRLWYLSAHHRSPLTFDTERLDEATPRSSGW
jgi:cysteinyl-tRNA synthetase